jgi:hypothetical protein
MVELTSSHFINFVPFTSSGGIATLVNFESRVLVVVVCLVVVVAIILKKN